MQSVLAYSRVRPVTVSGLKESLLFFDLLLQMLFIQFAKLARIVQFNGQLVSGSFNSLWDDATWKKVRGLHA